MDGAERAYAYALRVLTRRDHSEAELRRKMADRGIAPAVIDDTVTRLKRSGYLDDVKYALRWAESAVRNGKGYGYRLRCELSRRGIAEDVAADVAERMSAEYDEAETIRTLVNRKFAAFTPQDADERGKRRIVGYLQRRGFSLAAIIQVLRDIEGE